MRRAAIAAAAVGLSGCQLVFTLDDSDNAPTLSGLIARFPLDTIDDQSTPDVIGGRSGKCAGERCPTTTEGRRGGALQFDGVDDHFRVDTDPTLDLGGGLTVALWFRAEDYSGDFHIMAAVPFDNSIVDVWSLLVVANATNSTILPFFDTAFDSTSGPVSSALQSPQVVEAGVFHHMAVTWDGSTKTKVILLDGAVVTQLVVPETIVETGGPMAIGADINNDLAQFHFFGAIDEIQIYDHPLDTLEVLDLVR